MTPMRQIVPGFDIDTVTYAKDQPEYIPLPAWRSPDDPSGLIVTRWKLSWKERFLVAFGGSLWVSILTFHKPLQPLKLEATCPIMGHTGHDREI